MHRSIHILQEMNRYLPLSFTEPEIYSRVHKSQMRPVLSDIMAHVSKRAHNSLLVDTAKLQDAYLDKSKELYDGLRYNLFYFEALENRSAEDDSKACWTHVRHWSDEDEDHFCVFEHLPHLVADD